MTLVTDNKSVIETNYPSSSIDWLTRLIAFDTVSRHSNLALIEDVQSYCEQLGLSVDLTFNEAKNKANLFVTVPAGANANKVSAHAIKPFISQAPRPYSLSPRIVATNGSDVHA